MFWYLSLFAIQVICSKCNNISNQYENMMDLTVEIHGDAASLEECLDQFTAKEWLHGDNMYKCDGYGCSPLSYCYTVKVTYIGFFWPDVLRSLISLCHAYKSWHSFLKSFFPSSFYKRFNISSCPAFIFLFIWFNCIDSNSWFSVFDLISRYSIKYETHSFWQMQWLC